MLIFMPTEQDIRETCELIAGRRLQHVTVLPLFARLSAKDQARVFSPAVGRKIIVATNIAETSLTIPGVKYVIDAGLARISQYTPRSRTTSLQVRPISRSSADQRKGRCGRLENGICIRLYSEEDYLSRPQFTRPEILRSNLAEVILRMMALKLGSIADFPFIDQPDSRSITDGFDLLTELGAIRKTDDRQQTDRRQNGRWQKSEAVICRLSSVIRPLLYADRTGPAHVQNTGGSPAVPDSASVPNRRVRSGDRHHHRSALYSGSPGKTRGKGPAGRRHASDFQRPVIGFYRSVKYLEPLPPTSGNG